MWKQGFRRFKKNEMKQEVDRIQESLTLNMDEKKVFLTNSIQNNSVFVMVSG